MEQLKRLIEEKRKAAHNAVIGVQRQSTTGGANAQQFRQNLAAAKDDLIGFELLKIVLESAESSTVNPAGLCGDLQSKPGIGMSNTFRGAIMSRPYLFQLFVPWVAEWKNWEYLIKYLISEYKYSFSFVNVLRVSGYPGLNHDSWIRGGKNDLVMFERRLDVMYHLVAACYDGSDFSAIVPKALKQAISALIEQSHEHSLSKSPYQAVARNSRDGSF